MMYLFFLLFLLGHRVQGQGEKCWRDPCDPTDIDAGDQVINRVEAKDELDCQTQCSNSQETCVWFDFGGVNHPEKCVLLNDKCETKANDHSGGISGPAKCEDDPIPTCAFSQGEKDLQWECFDEDSKLVKAIEGKLPEGTSCITECYGNRYTTKCKKDGKWTDLESTAENDDDHKGKIMLPGEGGKCECDPITLEGKDPNLEPGAIFHCSEYTQFCDKSPIDITEGGCTLTCDGYQFVNFHCDDGAWYKNEEKMDDSEIDTLKNDLYCYDEKKTACPPKE